MIAHTSQRGGRGKGRLLNAYSGELRPGDRYHFTPDGDLSQYRLVLGALDGPGVEGSRENSLVLDYMPRVEKHFFGLKPGSVPSAVVPERLGPWIRLEWWLLTRETELTVASLAELQPERPQQGGTRAAGQRGEGGGAGAP